MPAYLTLAEYKLLSTIPDLDIERREAASPGWIDAQLEAISADIDARLRKRYAVPFASPYPHTIKRWLARIVTREIYLKTGIDPDDRQFQSIENSAIKAEEEIAEAADAVEGKFDLPLSATNTASAITSPGPYAYTEASPYVWKDLQARRGRQNDADGEGSE